MTYLVWLAWEKDRNVRVVSRGDFHKTVAEK